MCVFEIDSLTVASIISMIMTFIIIFIIILNILMLMKKQELREKINKQKKKRIFVYNGHRYQSQHQHLLKLREEIEKKLKEIEKIM